MSRMSAAAGLALLMACQNYAALAKQSDAAKVPPIVPAADEIRVLAVAAFPIHVELQECLKDAADFLAGDAGRALHVRIGPAQTFVSQETGYILRADFTRDDVSAPLINRIVCWHTGQLIASRISALPLSADATKALAIPQSPPTHN